MKKKSSLVLISDITCFTQYKSKSTQVDFISEKVFKNKLTCRTRVRKHISSPGSFCVYCSSKIHKYDHFHLYVKFTLPTEPMQREILGYFLRRPDYKFLSLARSSCAQETSTVLEIIIPFVVKKINFWFCAPEVHPQAYPQKL